MKVWNFTLDLCVYCSDGPEVGRRERYFTDALDLTSNESAFPPYTQ